MIPLVMALSLPFNKRRGKATTLVSSGGVTSKTADWLASKLGVGTAGLSFYAPHLALLGAVVVTILLAVMAYRRCLIKCKSGNDKTQHENGTTPSTPAPTRTSSFLASISRLLTPSSPPDRELLLRNASAIGKAKSKAVVTPPAKKKAVNLEIFVKRLFKEGMPVLKIKANTSPSHRKEKVLRIDNRAVLFFEATGFNWLTGNDKKSVWSAYQLKSVVDGDASNWELFVEFSEKQGGVSILHVAALSADDYDELKLGLLQLLAQIKSHPQHIVALLAGLSGGKVIEGAQSPGAATSATAATAAAPAPRARTGAGPAPATPSSAATRATPAVTPASTPASSIFAGLFSPSSNKAKPLVPKPPQPFSSLSVVALKELTVQNGLSDQGFIEKDEYVKLLESHYA